MRKILLITGAILVFGGGGAGWLLLQNKPPTQTSERKGVSSSQGKPAESTDPKGHSYMDADFAKKMIVHNQQGILIADLAKERAVNDEVRQIATSISQELSTETQQYISWLTEWKETYFNLSDFPQMEGHDMYPTGPGMASLGELDALKTATGSSVDEQFLDLMIKHHEGTKEMSNSIAFEKMQFGELVELKVKTLKQQAEEIRMMKQLQTKGG